MNLRIRIKGQESSNVTLEFSVVDTGIGISSSKIHNLFKPFSQLNHQKTYGGTGLGLVISQKIINAFGGKIEVER